MEKNETQQTTNPLLEALKKKREKQGLGIFGESPEKSGRKEKNLTKITNKISPSSSIGHRPTGR